MLGHGDGYQYPHDAPEGWVDQEYRPAEVANRQYWYPSGHGADVENGPRPASPGYEPPNVEAPPDVEPCDDRDRN